MSNPSKKVKVKGTDRIVEVYRLTTCTPTDKHIWCNLSGCSETFTESELEFI